MAVVAAVIGIVTIGPAMADKNSAPGQDKMDICHYDKDEGEYKKKTISQKAVDSHIKNHENDLVPAPEEGCPDKVDEELELVNVTDIDVLLGMFTEIAIFEQEVDNLQNQIDNINGMGNGNLIFRHVTDENVGGAEWNPNGATKNFLITDEEINANSVVSITINKPIGNEELIPNCLEQIVETSNDSYALGIDCSSQLPEGTQLNYVIMNPTL
jgi:hypothetical protein